MSHEMLPRIAVKRHTYRGRAGWLVYESRRHRCNEPLCFARGFAQRVFSESENEARRMAGELRRGLSPLFDYQIARMVADGMTAALRAAGYTDIS